MIVKIERLILFAVDISTIVFLYRQGTARPKRLGKPDIFCGEVYVCNSAIDGAGAARWIAPIEIEATDRGKILRIKRKSALADADSVIALILEVDVRIVVIGRRIAGAESGFRAAHGAAAMLRRTDLRLARLSLKTRFQDNVDHTADRVGTVNGGSAVLQHIDTIHDRERNSVQIHKPALAVISQRIISSAQTVDQHQRRVSR